MDHSSSSSSLRQLIPCNPNYHQTQGYDVVPMKKRKAGRKKFKETRHPVYRGVRRRNGNKWICEVREPNKKSRIWVGTFTSPEMAARAHDVAALALKEESAALNFPDSSSILPRAKSSSARDIRRAALDAVKAFQPIASSCLSSSSSSSDFLHVRTQENSSKPSISAEINEKNVLDEPFSMIIPCPDYSQRNNCNQSKPTFFDEEALFNMPVFLDNMAEGLILSPPALRRGFNWDDMECSTMDLTLWGDINF